MTLPPPDRSPDLPGGGLWNPTPQPPTFVSPAPPPTFVSPTPPPAMPGGTQEQFELAGWGSRLGAYLLDSLFRTVLAFGLAALAFVLFVDQPFSADASFWEEGGTLSTWSEDPEGLPDGLTDGSNNVFWLLVAGISLYVALAVFYAPVFMAMWRGATPGKRICGIRVVRENGAELGFGKAFVREPLVKGILMNGVASSFFLPWLVNYLWPLWDRECRAGHDLIVRTRVVKTRA